MEAASSLPDRRGAQTPVDPPLRADGRCAQCGGERKAILGVSKQTGSNRDALAQAKQDPFCTAKCCRVWHGAALEQEPRWAAYDELDRVEGAA